jgi:opacity protein-like surface antigen
VIAAVPAGAARAEVILTPFIGSAFSGSLDGSRTAYGGAVAFLGGGTFGIEAELGIINDFISDEGAVAQLESNKLNNLSLNLVLAVPTGSVRLYGTAGLSLLSPRIETRLGFDDLKEDKGGYDVGGGVFLFVSDHVALRGDLRFFRTFGDLDAGGGVDLGKLDYWRGAGGLSLRF